MDRYLNGGLKTGPKKPVHRTRVLRIQISRLTICAISPCQDESSIQVLGIQMLTVFIDKLFLFQIRNPRGLDENDVNDLVGNLLEKCHQYVGGPVIFELIDFCQV